MGCIWRARERELITGSEAEPPAGVQGQSPQRGQGNPPEADGILVLKHTFFALSWSLYSGSRSERSDQTKAYI